LGQQVQPAAQRARSPDRRRREESGVICQDVRANTTVSEYVNWVDYCVKLVGVDHVSVAAQDDFHLSHKDTQRIAPYVPTCAAELRKRD
jgi:microsomal dipeptidase-like Zn-dependent dipeptidase